MKRIFAILMLLALALSSCRSEPADSAALTQAVEWSQECANMTLNIPESWSWKAVDEEHRIGVALIPPEAEGDPSQTVGIYCYPDGIGLCGMVYRKDELTLTNGMETFGYFDKYDDSVSYTVVLPGTAGTYVLMMSTTEEFYDANIDTILAILGGGRYGEGFMTEAEAIARAEEMRTDMNGAINTTRAVFDISTGMWTVKFWSTYNAALGEEFVIDGRNGE